MQPYYVWEFPIKGVVKNATYLVLQKIDTDAVYGAFKIGGQEFDLSHFFDYRGGPTSKTVKFDIILPSVYTVDEWFAANIKEDAI